MSAAPVALAGLRQNCFPVPRGARRAGHSSGGIVHVAEISWAAFYTGTLSLAALLLSVMGAVVSFAGTGIRDAKKKVLRWGAYTALAELFVAAMTSLSRMLPGTALVQVVPSAAVAVAVALTSNHVARSVSAHRSGNVILDRAGVLDLLAYMLTFSAFSLILWSTWMSGEEWEAAAGVLWLIASGLFQSVRFLVSLKD